MFHHPLHFDIWNNMHAYLKRNDDASIMRIWNDYLPQLTVCYDDLRMLYYLGRYGNRDIYQRICATLSPLRASDPAILKYRLSIFRYAVEHASMSGAPVKTWMLDDLAEALGITRDDFPAQKLEMPASLVAALRAIDAPQPNSYMY